MNLTVPEEVSVKIDGEEIGVARTKQVPGGIRFDMQIIGKSAQEPIKKLMDPYRTRMSFGFGEPLPDYTFEEREPEINRFPRIFQKGEPLINPDPFSILEAKPGKPRPEPDPKPNANPLEDEPTEG